MFIYVVKKGDNLFNIAKQFNVRIQEIETWNAINRKDTLVIGQSLIILKPEIIHSVAPNESLADIANEYDVPIENIFTNNNIAKPYSLVVGQKIIIRSPYKSTNMYVNAFAFPGVKEEDYMSSHVDLSFLSVFSYGIKENGSLIKIDDKPIVDNVIGRGIKPLMTITNMNQEGSFSTTLANKLLNNSTAGDTIITEVLDELNAKKYYGLCVDFEYIDKYDKDAYISFLEHVKNRLNNKYPLFVCLAPKINAFQKGTLYQAHDYEAIGRIADFTILMTYEWGFTYGPALPVAPLDKVEQVLKYAVTDIDPSKIIMGMPTYGYDFIVPFKKGNKAKPIAIDQCIDDARNVRSSIMYDKTWATPYYKYYQGTKEHIVYFEDPRATAKKIELAKKYKLAGISLWVLSSTYVQMWNTISELINVRKK